jgi:hypothetical protein
MAKREVEIRLCTHQKSNGSLCGSPALKEESYCYFHLNARERHLRQRRAARQQKPLQQPLLDDASAIQIAIGDTLNALLLDRVDVKTAALQLRGLQTAHRHAGQTDFDLRKYERCYGEFVDQESELEELVEQDQENEEEEGTDESEAQNADEPEPEEQKKGQKLPPKKKSAAVADQAPPAASQGPRRET